MGRDGAEGRRRDRNHHAKAGRLVVMSARALSPRVVPAKAGTHNHRRPWLREVSANVPQEKSRGMGPGVRRDDDWNKLPPHVVPAKAGTHSHRRTWLREVSASVLQERSRGMGPGVRRDDEYGH